MVRGRRQKKAKIYRLGTLLEKTSQIVQSSSRRPIFIRTNTRYPWKSNTNTVSCVNTLIGKFCSRYFPHWLFLKYVREDIDTPAFSWQLNQVEQIPLDPLRQSQESLVYWRATRTVLWPDLYLFLSYRAHPEAWLRSRRRDRCVPARTINFQIQFSKFLIVAQYAFPYFCYCYPVTTIFVVAAHQEYRHHTA